MNQIQIVNLKCPDNLQQKVWSEINWPGSHHAWNPMSEQLHVNYSMTNGLNQTQVGFWDNLAICFQFVDLSEMFCKGQKNFFSSTKIVF